MNQCSSRNRSLPLDVFRGLVIATMILVNAQGDYQHAFSPFMHVDWNGIHLADCVFPFFVFVMGVSIAYALGDKRQHNPSIRTLEYQITKRSIKLFVLGVVLNAIPNYIMQPFASNYLDFLACIRMMGVLQRLALVYFVVSLLFLNTTSRQRYVLMLLTLLLYTLILAFLPYPITTNGHTIWTYGHLDKYNNVIAYIDNAILGREHLLYFGLPLSEDPEGLFSTLPSLFNAIAGLEMGLWLKMQPKPTYPPLLKAGFGLTLGGYALSYVIPINKSLWTAPFTLITTGLAVLTFSVCLLSMSKLSPQSRLIKPFLILGVNSLAFYFLSSALIRLSFAIPIHKTTLHHALFEPFKSNIPSIEWAAMLYALAFWGVCFLPMWALYRRNIFIKV